MSAITTTIRRRRDQLNITQEEMADRLHITVGAYRKIEKGTTKMDLARLEEIAKILETTVVDLINSVESIYIHSINNNEVGFNNKDVTIHKSSEKEILLLEQLIAAKDQIIADKEKEILYLRELLAKKM